MKKILVIFGLMMSTMCVYAVNFALSDGDFGLNANITREGDNVRLQYKINGMSSVPETPEITAEQRQALSEIGDVDFDILASCSEPKVKILSMNIYNKNNSLVTSSSSLDWVTLEKAEDIAKLKELCSKI